MKPTIIFLTTVLLSFFASAQNWETGLMGGASTYRGDLSPYITPSEIHPAVGFYVKKNMSQFFSFNVGFNQGTISGNDNNNKYLEKRNQRFKSDITELSATFEFNFFPFLKGLKPDQFTPFVFSGLALFKFNPVTEFENQTYELAKYNTEGQSVTDNAPSDYSLYQPSIPIGGGIKVRIANRFNIGLKVGYRATFFDFLDDVSTDYPNKEQLAKESPIAAQLSDRSESGDKYYAGQGKQRGNPQTNDWYIFTGITLSYHIENPNCYDFN